MGGAPGGGGLGEVQRGDWLPLLAQAAGSGSIMAAVCTGTMLLAHAGVVGTRRAATHHAAWGDLAATGGPPWSRTGWSTTAPCITCGGVTAGLDLALWIVERFDSAERAEEIGVIMEISTEPADDGMLIRPFSLGSGEPEHPGHTVVTPCGVTTVDRKGVAGHEGRVI